MWDYPLNVPWWCWNKKSFLLATILSSQRFCEQIKESLIAGKQWEQFLSSYIYQLLGILWNWSQFICWEDSYLSQYLKETSFFLIRTCMRINVVIFVYSLVSWPILFFSQTIASFLTTTTKNHLILLTHLAFYISKKRSSQVWILWWVTRHHVIKEERGWRASLQPSKFQ